MFQERRDNSWFWSEPGKAASSEKKSEDNLTINEVFETDVSNLKKKVVNLICLEKKGFNS